MVVVLVVAVVVVVVVVAVVVVVVVVVVLVSSSGNNSSRCDVPYYCKCYHDPNLYVCVFREEMDDQNAAQGIGKSSSNYKEAMKISKTWSSAAAKTTMG